MIHIRCSNYVLIKLVCTEALLVPKKSLVSLSWSCLNYTSHFSTKIYVFYNYLFKVTASCVCFMIEKFNHQHLAWKSGVNPRPCHVEFVLGNMALGLEFLVVRVHRFSAVVIILLIFDTHYLIHLFFVDTIHFQRLRAT